MEHQPAVYALERLHAELGGKLQANKQEAKRLADDMRHVEAVLRMLEPDFDIRKISVRRRYKPNPLFKRGDVFRQVLGVLRTVTAPMTAREIVVALYKGKGIDPSTAQIRSLFGSVQASLRNHLGKNVETIGEGMPAKWVIKP